MPAALVPLTTCRLNRTTAGCAEPGFGATGAVTPESGGPGQHVWNERLDETPRGRRRHISEGIVELIIDMLRESLEATVTRKLGAVLSRDAYRELKKRVDYSEYGGAPLLGVKGVNIICHGRSNANAIKNAIRVAAEFARGRVNEKIEAELERSSSSKAVAT